MKCKHEFSFREKWTDDKGNKCELYKCSLCEYGWIDVSWIIVDPSTKEISYMNIR